MTDPEKITPDQRDREIGVRNLVRMVGLFGLVFGLGLIVISAADLIKSIATDGQVRYDYLFFLGLMALIVGWWFVLAGYERPKRSRYTDCPACGSLNDVDAPSCRVCGHLIS